MSAQRKLKRKVAELKKETGPIEITWELAELPSSQHRAGLAGLVLMVEHLRRREFQGTCEIVRCDARGATLRVDATGMQALFDEVYAASLDETRVKKPWKDKEPKREEHIEILRRTKKGETVTSRERRFVYDVVVPRGGFLAHVESPAASGSRPWLKLFQDMEWEILRGRPQQRIPFNNRANGNPSTDGRKLFKRLASVPEGSVPLPSTYYLGAQRTNAEQVPFRDRERFQALLHFWPYAARIYVPAIENADGERDFAGFAIAVPDVGDLATFVKEWVRSLRERDPALAGYRPREAVIDIPAEAGVDLLVRVRGPLASREAAARTADLVLGVDVFHCEKDGKNVRIRSVARVRPDVTVTSEYARVRSAYWSAPFRAQRVRNVLAMRPWWYGFVPLLISSGHERTFDAKYFRRDVREAFERNEGIEMTEEGLLTIEALVYRTVGIYLGGRLSLKYGLEWESVKGDEERRRDYHEKREKLAREAFLAVRSRTATDFVAYFASTLCSIPQRLDEERYELVASELARDPEKIRTLTLLALSARA